MNKGTIRTKKTILGQFIIVFICTVAPIILCGVLLIGFQTKIIQNEIEKNAEASVKYGIERLEAQVLMINRLQNNFINDNDLNRFLLYYNRVPNYEYYTMVSAVLDRMAIIKDGNECIKDVGIYISDIGVSISLSGRYSKLSIDEYQNLSNIIECDGGPIYFSDNDIYTLLQYPIVNNKKSSKYIIKISLSPEKFFHEYLEKGIDNDNCIFLYDHIMNQLIYMPRDGMDELAENISTYVDIKKGKKEISYNGQRYLMVTGYSEYLEQFVIQCIPMTNIFRVKNRLFWLLGAYVIFSIILALSFPNSVKRIVKRPINQLIKAFENVEKGNLQVQISYQASDEFNYLYEKFNHMLNRLVRLIDENYRSKLYAQQAELKQMQAQIRPHFLYNTYFMLHRMILDEDLEYAIKLSEHLGSYMEYITHNYDEVVALENEVEHMRRYLEIQSMRFGKRIQICMEELPEPLRKVQVPRLILQPVVENYLKYGYEVSEEYGALCVSYEEKEGVFCIIVSGGCTEIDEQKVKELEARLASEVDTIEVTGLINIHRRLRLTFGASSGIQLAQDEKGRLITTLCLCGITEITSKENGYETKG